MPSPNLREIPRDRLMAVFKNAELVLLFEEIIRTLNDTLPGDTTAVEAALAAHIADAVDAHQASAIGATPGGTRSSNTVQGQLGNLDVGKVNTTDIVTAAMAFLGTPSSANLRAALTDETGTGAAVFGTGPTINSPTLTGTTYSEQVNTTSKGAAATLTTAELLAAIIEYTGAAATLTLPAGSAIDTAIPGLGNNGAFAFSVINTGSGAATMGTAAGLTLVGSMSVAAGTSGLFRVRRTAAATYTVYRIA
jgi:hypothetical protein